MGVDVPWYPRFDEILSKSLFYLVLYLATFMVMYFEWRQNVSKRYIKTKIKFIQY